MQEQETRLTESEVRALGWCYGRLSRALGRKTYQSPVRYSQACERPLKGFTELHRIALREHVIDDALKAELAEALAGVDVEHVDEHLPINVHMQGVWQICESRAHNGRSWAEVAAEYES